MADLASGVRIVGLGPSCPELPIVDPASKAVAIVWPGTGATQRSMHHIDLVPGGHTVPLRHAGEAVYYVRTGAGSVRDPDAGSRDELIEGSMVHIEPGTAYQFTAGPAGMVLLGGPCPPDPQLYAHLQE